jgi:hypothetical protein
MLATVVLYFQQLPSAQLLFQLHKDAMNEGPFASAGAGASTHSKGGHRSESEMKLLQTQQQYERSQQQRSDQAELGSMQHHPWQCDTLARSRGVDDLGQNSALAAVLHLLFRVSGSTHWRLAAADAVVCSCDLLCCGSAIHLCLIAAGLAVVVGMACSGSRCPAPSAANVSSQAPLRHFMLCPLHM